MKRWKVWVMAAGMMAISGCAAGYQQTEVRGSASTSGPGGAVSVSYFYDALAPYGQWVEEEPYGWCWAPDQVEVGWRPYTNGYWAYTDFGWTWVSTEPWSWACDHYGRWLDDPVYGWVWVPGTEWGPAWVAWRYGDDWVGWAPLPPTASWDVSVGLRFVGGDALPASSWCFAPRARLGDTRISVAVASVARNETLLERTRDATRFESRSGRPVNLGPAVDAIERDNGRPVRRVRIVDAVSPTRGHGQSVGGGGIALYRPRLRPEPAAAPPREAMEPRRTLPEPEIARARDTERRRLESALAQEQARLESDHQRELRTPPAGVEVDQVRRRHDAENQAFQRHAEQERDRLEKRWQKRMAERDRDSDRPDSRGKRKGRGRQG